MNRKNDPEPAVRSSEADEGANCADPAAGIGRLAALATGGEQAAEALAAFVRELLAGLPAPGAAPAPAIALPGPGLREREEEAELAALAARWQAALAEVLDDCAAVVSEAGAQVPGPPATDPAEARVALRAWIEAAESAWSQYAFSDEGAARIAHALHSWLHWRAAHDRRLHRAMEALGLPSRRELDDVHRRLARMRRQGGP